MKKWLPSLIALFLFATTTQGQQSADQVNFYDVGSIHELKITFSQPNWPDLLDSLRRYGEGMLLANLNVDGRQYNDVGIRYRGTKSFRTDAKRNPLHIMLNYIKKDQNHQGYKNLKLSNALRDPSLVREVLSYEVAGQYMPAPRANYAKLFVNGEYYGLFVNLEAIDHVFVQRHFGSDDNSFFKAKPTKGTMQSTVCKNNVYASLEYEGSASCYLSNYVMKSRNGWDDLIELTRVLTEQPDNVESVLNVDRTLWMLAFNNVLVNLSSYSGQVSENYYLYEDEKGQFNPIVWDLNLSFGSFKNIGKGSDLKLKELQRLDPLLHEGNVTKPLISQLLSNPLYKKVYLSHIRTILYDHFVNGEYEKRAEELQRMISDAHFKDPNKQYKHEEFLASLKKTTGKRSKIPGIVELMSERARFLKKHKAISIIPPTVEEVTVTKREKFSNETVNTFKIQAKVDKLPKRVKLFYRFSKDDLFKEVFMADDGRNNDGEAGDKVFGVTIDPKGASDTIEYFIMAENASAASFDPPNYMNKPYLSNLKDLN